MTTNQSSRDHVLLTNYAVTNTSPTDFSLNEHPLQIAGLAGSSTWSGAYGLVGAERAFRFLHQSADAKGFQCYQLQTSIGLRDLKQNQGCMTREQVLHTGLLHCERIRAEFRDELHHFLLARLALDLDGAQMAPLRSLPLPELMARQPNTAKFLLDALEPVTMVVHPVRLLEGDERPISVGTIRRQGRERYRSETRYLEDRCPVR